jgi:hypothetical protein
MQKMKLDPDNTGCEHVFDPSPENSLRTDVGVALPCIKCQNMVVTVVSSTGHPTAIKRIVVFV